MDNTIPKKATINLFNNVILILIILSSLSFFEFKFIPVSITKAMNLVMIGIIIALIGIQRAYNKLSNLKRTFNPLILMMFIGVFLSMIGAYAFHDQGFKTTAIVQRAFYYILVYYLLHELKIHPNSIHRIIIYLSLTYAFLYLIQTVIFPAKLFDCAMFKERGTIRIFLKGSGYCVVAFFLCLTQYFRTYKIYYMLIAMLMFIVFLLLGSRQVLFSIMFGTVLYLLINKKVKNKFFIILLSALGFIPLLIVFKDVVFSRTQRRTKY